MSGAGSTQIQFIPKPSLQAVLEGQSREPGKLAAAACAFTSFAVTLAACLVTNIFSCPERVTLATDGRHYLTTASMVADLLAGRFTGAVSGSDGIAGHLLLDGPLMTLFYSPMLAFLNHTAGARDWFVLALGQSVVLALAATTVTLVTLRVCRNPYLAVGAGLVSGLYPPALLKTGHFMSEIPTALLLPSFVLFGSSRKLGLLALAGLVAGLLIVSKPALAPVLALSLLFVVINLAQTGEAAVRIKDTLTSLLRPVMALALPLLLVTGLWASIAHQTTGNWSFTAQRQPAYNVAKAWNSEGDGWGCNPHPPLTDMYSDADGPLNIMLGLWQSRTSECLTLLPRKLARLTVLPWNDFKNSVLTIDMAAQTLWHQMLISAGIFGMALYLLIDGSILALLKRYGRVSIAAQTLSAIQFGRDERGSKSRIALELSILLILGHLSYLLVESTARYFFSAMPLVIVVAAYGLWRSRQLQGGRGPILILFAAMAAVVSTSLLTHADKFTRLDDPKNLRELGHTLECGMSCEKVIDLGAVKQVPSFRDVVLFIDGDKRIEDASVTVNGVRLKGHIHPVNDFDAIHYRLYDQYREFTPNMGIENADLRQWRAVEVPRELVNWRGKNVIVVRSESARPAMIYGDANTTSRYYLSPDYFSYGMLSSTLKAAGAESRVIESTTAADIQQQSSILAAPGSNSSEARSRLVDSLRIRLVGMSGSRTAEKDLLDSDKDLVTTYKIGPQDFDPLLTDRNEPGCLRINKPVLYAARTVGASVPLSPVSPAATHLKVKIHGMVRAAGTPGKAGFGAALSGKAGTVMIGSMPPFLRAGTQWKTFEIENIVPLAAVGGTASSVDLALYPVPWVEAQYGASRRCTDASFKDLTVEVSEFNLPDLSGRRVVY